MNLADMDFSLETDFQERLLKKIKRECFAELSDDDLGFVNAAGKPMIIMPGIVKYPDQLQQD